MPSSGPRESTHGSSASRICAALGVPHLSSRHYSDSLWHARNTPHAHRHTDMPHADHALPHIASAFLRAGSCLERAQRHNATPLTPRQVFELCTFRLHQLTCASQPEVSQTKAVRANVASPLGVLAQRSPCPPRPPEVGWPSACTARGMARRLTGAFAEFPCLADRAAPTSTSLERGTRRGSIHPGPLANASSPHAVCLSVRRAHRRIYLA